MTVFLTREETERVTGYKSKRHQKLWLTAPYKIRVGNFSDPIREAIYG